MTQRNYKAALAATGILSLTLHVTIIYVMHHRYRKSQLNKSFTTESVKLRIVEQHPAPALTAAPSKSPVPAAKKPDTPKPAAPPTQTNTTQNPNPDEDQRPYEQLFPAANWPSGTVSIPSGSSSIGTSDRGPPPSTAAQRITSHLSGQLDIPLVYREQTPKSRAVAKFRRNSDGRWYFDYIDGDPILRAVLFEAFQRRDNLQKIDQLATELKRTEILFVLQQTTKPALNGWKQFSDDIGYEQGGAKVVYSRTILTGHDGSSGIILPDEEAKRAIRRDNVAFMRLMNSPAYLSRIRNRRIEEKRD